MARSLNYDVLDHILHYCSSSTLNNHCLVSSQFRLLAIPHLLRDVCLDRNPAQIVSFLNFIIANTQKDINKSNSDRHAGGLNVGWHVFSLRILKSAFFTADKVWKNGRWCSVRIGWEQYPIRTWASSLSSALELMPNIRSIVIGANVEDIASLSDDFGRSLLSRPLLTDIELCDVGPITSFGLGREAELKRSTTSIRSFKFRGYNNADPLELSGRKGIGRFLMHSRETLEEIHFDSSVMHNLLAHGDVTSHGPQLIFPNVMTVSLRMCDVHLDALAKSFPALTNLTIGLSPSFTPDDWTGNAALFPNLVSVKGDYRYITHFLQSNSACPRLCRLVIDNLWDHTLFGDPTLLIEQAAPGLRSLHVGHINDGRQVLAWWRAVVRASPSITFLALSFNDYATEISPPSTLCIQLPHLLASMPLIYISLTFKGNVGSRATVEVQDPISEYAIAVSYAANVKTLEYIDVLLKTSQSWWKISRARCNLVGNEDTVAVDVVDEAVGMKTRDWYDQAVFRK
ncbi:hypothetical protein CPB84DRAFT_1784213 [Gymnopilus junonius]|uniref:F-box domain-containing protein n=1 Tax=Gymnopilus junonius TaxID=109634 RepID=A0A9P5TK85_GYMJU|nr:hypothetical protein CPB84DRAFT_1784213 [Gymnopilus junonius]